jgi:hypothetical protein
MSTTSGNALGGARTLGSEGAAAAAARQGRARKRGAGRRRPRAGAHRGSRQRLDRASDEAARARRGADARRAASRRAASFGCRASRSANGATFMVSDAGGAEPAIWCWRKRPGRPPRITVRVTERLGDPFAPRSFSLIAIHKLGIPDIFGETIEEANGSRRLPLWGRTARTCAICRSSRSTRPMRATMTTPSGPRPTTIPPMNGRVEGDRRDRRCQLLCPPRFGARPRGDGGAATASISPTASCRCCPRILSADMCSLKAGRGSRGAGLPPDRSKRRTARSRAGASPARWCGSRRTLPMRMRRRRSTRVVADRRQPHGDPQGGGHGA